MKIDILTLFPEFFSGPFNVSLLARAQKNGLVHIDLTQIRDFAFDKHRKVDDRPFGGGPGMVMKPEPVAAAIRSKRQEGSHVIYLTPQGRPLTAKRAQQLATCPHLILLCGHYEGIDERVIQQEVDEEISIGDYVLISGCTPALVLVEAVCRFIPGFLGDEQSAYQESFQEDGLLDCPHYTRPCEFEGLKVPDVLLNGNHAEIAKWRKQQALEKTTRVRPELV
jgi:tRNA (guanine37-N1)-methyltransferase